MHWVLLASIVQWGLRFTYDHSAAISDACYVTAFAIWPFRHSIPAVFRINYVLFLMQGWSSVYLQLICGTLWLQCLSCFFDCRQYRSYEQDRQARDDIGQASTEVQQDSPLKPLLFPCRTSHTRLFPKKNSFSYSYLFVGVPIGWRGSVGNVLSADSKSLPRGKITQVNTWFSVSSACHLGRGDSLDGLKGKLDKYLEHQVRKAFLECF